MCGVSDNVLLVIIGLFYELTIFVILFFANMKKRSLFEQLCEERTLLDAWLMVKAKNSSGGIDGYSVQHYDNDIGKHLGKLRSELSDGVWEPYPYLRVEIAKSNNEKRQLGLLSIKDKIVQQAILNLIQPQLDRLFVNNSYGYRPGKGPVKAVNRTRDFMYAHPGCWVLRHDIDNFFDTVDHDILFRRLVHYVQDEELRRLIHLCVTMGNVNKSDKWKDSKKGLPQGSLLSPLLANFMLHPFDQFVLSRTERYVRYADDFVLFADTEEQAGMFLSQIEEFLFKRLGLQINQPPHVSKSEDGFEFLGIRIDRAGYSLSDKKYNHLVQCIEKYQLDENGALDTASMQSYAGIKNYYGRLLSQDMLSRIDMVLIDKMRSLVELGHATIGNKKKLSTGLTKVQFLSEKNILDKKTIVQSIVDAYLLAKSKGKDKGVAIERNRRIVSKRKVEYHRREAEGAELLVNTPGTYISVSGGYVIVKKQQKPLSRHSLSTLRHITILTNGVSISSNTIDSCMEHKVPIDFFDPVGKHRASVLSPKYLEASLWECQMSQTLSQRFELGRRIMMGKVRNQLNLIKYFDKYHSRGNESLKVVGAESVVALSEKVNQLKGSDCCDDYKEKLMAIEAQSAVVYWNYIRNLLSDDGIVFEQRVRQGATDLFNALLNYGYALLYARVWQALLAAKLNPYDSVLHVRQKGKPTFVFDVVELFRSQAVDRVVVSMVQKRLPLEIDNGKLTAETRALLAGNIIERFNRYEKYRGEEMLFGQIIHRQAAEIANYVEKDVTFKPYIAKW